MVSDIKPDIHRHFLHSNWRTLRRKYLSKIPTAIKVLSCGRKLKSVKPFREFRAPFFPRDIRENPRSTYGRVPQAMAQFVLKIEKLSHIMGPTPMLEMVRAYGLRPRFWLLVYSDKPALTFRRWKCKKGKRLTITANFQERNLCTALSGKKKNFGLWAIS